MGGGVFRPIKKAVKKITHGNPLKRLIRHTAVGQVLNGLGGGQQPQQSQQLQQSVAQEGLGGEILKFQKKRKNVRSNDVATIVKKKKEPTNNSRTNVSGRSGANVSNRRNRK